MRFTQIKEGLNRFTSSHMSVESGQPQTTRLAAVFEKMKNVIIIHRRLTARETAEQIDNSTDSLRANVYDHELRNSFPSFCRWNRKTSSCTLQKDQLDTINAELGFLSHLCPSAE
ncbi:hypothetical protein TNCV_4567511 [Trichonephila clavipes]|nr:hypothetical protein TNCV_4567511 [Trichonephila clavipes]